MTTARPHLFVARVHCSVNYGISGYEQFTETRVFPVGMTFAQVEAITAEELRDTHTLPSGIGWRPTPRCKVTMTARPKDDPRTEIGKARPLLYQTFEPRTPLSPFWMVPAHEGVGAMFHPKLVAMMAEFARTSSW